MPPDLVTDPYSYYARLRSEDPVHGSPGGLWILTRYDDVALALRDPRFGRKGFAELAGSESSEEGLAASMLFQDPPDHTRIRTLVSKAFNPRTIESLRPHAQQILDGLLDRV